MSADPDIERIVSEFADLLRRRLYQQRDMYSAALAAQAATITADLERIRRTLPTTVEPFPEVSDTTTQTNCEESNEEPSIEEPSIEEPSIEEPSIEPSWVTTSSISIDSIEFVPSTLKKDTTEYLPLFSRVSRVFSCVWADSQGWQNFAQNLLAVTFRFTSRHEVPSRALRGLW